MRLWRNDPEALRDAAALLPLAAAVLLLPPIVLIFAAPATIGGVPLIVAYVFLAWAAVVLSAWFIARGHERNAGDGRPGGEPEVGPDRR
jgi:hypothetical protein